MDHQLPNEILTKILGYLKSVDLLHFCQAYKHLAYFLSEKRVIRFSDWSREFELHHFNLCQFISTKMDPNGISVLNINYLYWIPAEELRKLIRKLNNLEELQAIDTKLGFHKKDVMEYLKLKKLAVSVEDDHFVEDTMVASEHMRALKSLCFKIIFKKDQFSFPGMQRFFLNREPLEELWIIDESPYGINYTQWQLNMTNMRTFVIRSKSNLPISNFTYNGLSRVFLCCAYSCELEQIFERIPNRELSSKRSIFEPKENALEKAWEFFVNVCGDIPCGPMECKLLNLNEEISNINFEDLNFGRSSFKCNSKFNNSALQVLLSENSKGLKRLNFRSCLFQYFVPQVKQIAGFKKARYGIETETANHPFQKVAQNLKNLTELEICICNQCDGNGVISAYPLIGIFENLQRLTINIPLLLDGSFLKQVFMKCEKLEWLTLICATQNEKFMINLCQNLKYSTALKHFRLQHNQIVIDKLLSSLAHTNKKLLRIFLECDNLRFMCESDPFSVFMENNPQLIYFHLVIRKATSKQISDIQKTMQRFKIGNSAKQFYVKKDIEYVAGVPIPTLHHDMVSCFFDVRPPLERQWIIIRLKFWWIAVSISCDKLLRVKGYFTGSGNYYNNVLDR